MRGRQKDLPPAVRRRSVAAAISYNANDDDAPSVAESGSGEAARRILALARRYGIPIERAPELTTELLLLDSGEEIPPRLYTEVAKVIKRHL